MAKLSIRDLKVESREVLMRVDFNVPLQDGEITDDTRIAAALPSIKHLLAGGARLVLCSHLGRPKGEPDVRYSLKPAGVRLGELLKHDVSFASDCIGVGTAAKRAALGSGPPLRTPVSRWRAAGRTRARRAVAMVWSICALSTAICICSAAEERDIVCCSWPVTASFSAKSGPFWLEPPHRP